MIFFVGRSTFYRHLEHQHEKVFFGKVARGETKRLLYSNAHHAAYSLARCFFEWHADDGNELMGQKKYECFLEGSFHYMFHRQKYILSSSRAPTRRGLLWKGRPRRNKTCAVLERSTRGLLARAMLLRVARRRRK